MYTYYAFISYSHKDKRFARKLQEKLEFYNLTPIIHEITEKKIRADKDILKMLAYKSNKDSVYLSENNRIIGLLKQKIKKTITAGKAKLYPMCRDAGTFSPGSSVNGIINSHLDASKKLIVLCSDNSLVNSKNDNEKTDFIKNEIKHFIVNNNGTTDNIIFVNVYGKKDIICRAGDIIVSIIREMYEELKNKSTIANEKMQLIEYEKILARYYEEKQRTNEDVCKINYDYVLENRMPLLADGTEKYAFLRIISSMLGIDFDFIKKRDKDRRRKNIIKTCILALLSCSIISWIFANLIINNNIEKAKNLKSQDLSQSIELLLHTEKIANFPTREFAWHNDSNITTALNEVLNYDAGTLLRKVNVFDDYISSGHIIEGQTYAELYANSFGYGQKILIDLTNGKKIAEYNISEGKLIVENIPLKGSFKTESGTYGNIIDVKDNIYLVESGVDVKPDTVKLWRINVNNGTIESIAVKPEWESYKQTFGGVYYIFNNNLHFCDYDGNDEVVKNNVGIFYADDNGIYSSDVECYFCGIPNCKWIESLPNSELLRIIDAENNAYVFDKQSSQLLNTDIVKYCDYIDISQDRRFIAYGDKDQITVEETGKKQSFTIYFDKAAVACAFRPDSKALWIINTRGELRTYALESSYAGTELDAEVIFDANDANICWISGENGTYKYDLLNNVQTKIIDKSINFVSQTDNEIVFTVNIPESRAPITRCFDKNTGKICESDLDPIKESYSKKSNEEDEICSSMQNYLDSHFYEGYITYDYQQVSDDCKYWSMYGGFIKNNMPSYEFRIYDVESKKEIFKLQYEKNKKYPFVEQKNNREYKPVFDETGHYFLVSYESADDLRIRTAVYEISGKLMRECEGNVIFAKGMPKYWKENILLQSKTNQYINIMGNARNPFSSAKTVLDFCKNVSSESHGNLLITTNEDVVKYNANETFYKPLDITAIPEIRIICTDEAGNKIVVDDSSTIEISSSWAYSIDITDPNGVYETAQWLDDESFKTTTFGLNNIPISIPPRLYGDGKHHTLHVSVISNTNRVTEKNIDFIITK